MDEESTNSESADQALSNAVAEAIAEVDPVVVLTNDLQRLQADFQNYRKRIDKERSESSELITGLVLAQFLGALDDIDRAQEHGELSGGFKAVADQLTTTTTKLGLSKFVDTGIIFDPHIHEALMHETSPDVSETQVTKVLRAGYKFKERVLRPAQVIVTDPEQ